jgi:hypothetical protein
LSCVCQIPLFLRWGADVLGMRDIVSPL